MFKTYKAQAWLLLAPALILLVAFTYLPIGNTLWRSVFGFGVQMGDQASSENYGRLLDDPVFYQVLKNSALYALITVPASIFFALIMALWVNGKIAGTGFMRFSFFTPTMLPMISVANIWLLFYSSEIGLFNAILGWFGLSGVNWLGNPDTALYSLMTMTIWKEAGFFMIFYLAALQTISPDLYKAAKTENASSLYTFRRITFPLLMPTTLFVFVNALLNSFKLIDHLFILTKGGPNNATNLLLYYIYENSFAFFDTAYASALTAVLLLILIVMALIQFGVIERRIHY
ncbi:sugar ABC transporter permease [Marinomonas sp. 5E14-1]|uniref:carbohydrate ABC transporter permease n=1 Tax=Marinomonas sp. 5E14-1 TaxID=3153922 RepID=UPI003264623F